MIGRALRALTVYSPLHAIDRVVRAVALYCGGAVLAALMTVILIDVVGRYVFNSPPEWISGVCVKVLAAGVTAIWSWRLFVTGETAARLGESTQLLNIPFSPVYKALSIGVGLYAAVLVIEAVVLAVKREVPVLLDESRAMGNPQ